MCAIIRSGSVVPEVRVRCRTLDAKGNRARDWLRTVQSRMFLFVSWICVDGRQCHAQIHNEAD